MVNRKVVENRAFNGNIFRMEVSEYMTKQQHYKEAINKCCMPGCQFGHNLEVHHIVPIKKGGTDSFDNYLILCSDCHRHSRIHRYSEQKMLQLYIFKFFVEQDVLGFTSDTPENSEEEFHLKIREFLVEKKEEMIKRKEIVIISCLQCGKKFQKVRPWDKLCKECRSKQRL